MRILAIAVLLAQAVFNDGDVADGGAADDGGERDFMRRCVEEEKKPPIECAREKLIRFGKSPPLRDGELVTGKSERLRLRVSGDRWLRQGWGGADSGVKDLGLLTETLSFLDFEIRDPGVPSPTESLLVAELGVMVDDFFAKLADYRVSPEYLGDPAFFERVLPSGNLLKLAFRCYTFAGTTNCAYVGAVEAKDTARGIIGHSTGSLHPAIGAMLDSVQLR